MTDVPSLGQLFTFVLSILATRKTGGGQRHADVDQNVIIV